jgi:hypothetical protein
MIPTPLPHVRALDRGLALLVALNARAGPIRQPLPAPPG